MVVLEAPLPPQWKLKSPPQLQGKKGAIMVTNGTKARSNSAWLFLGLVEAPSWIKVDNQAKMSLKWRLKSPHQSATAHRMKAWQPTTKVNIPALWWARTNNIVEQITTSIAITSTVTLIHTHTVGMGEEALRALEAYYVVLQDWSAWKGLHLLLLDPPLCLHPHRARECTPRPATTTTLPPHSPLPAQKWAKSPRVAQVLQVLQLFLSPFSSLAPLLYCSVSRLACRSKANLPLPPFLLLLILVSPPPLLSYSGGLRTSQQYPPPSESPHEVGEQRHWVHLSAAMASTWKWQQTTHRLWRLCSPPC